MPVAEAELLGDSSPAAGAGRSLGSDSSPRQPVPAAGVVAGSVALPDQGVASPSSPTDSLASRLGEVAIGE
eukprot:11171182-Alexandrium_andersonii.AAC.1